MRERQFVPGLRRLALVQDFAGNPEDAEPEQDAHKGRQMRDLLERRHSDENAETHRQYEIALEGRHVGSLDRARRFVWLAPEPESHDDHWNEKVDDGCQEQRLDDT